MVNIYEYFDYRLYLNDFWQSTKKEKPYFSIRFIASKVGLNPGYIIKVMQSKVHLGVKNIPAFADLLKLKDRERKYFEELVYFGREKNEKQIEYRYKRLNAIKGIQMKTVADNEVEFYQNWYNMAIRSLISIYPFKGNNYKKLASLLTPSITAKQARQSIALLERLNLVKKNESGYYILTEEFISTGAKWMSPIIRNYQKQNIELSAEALSRHDKKNRDISTVTMTFALKHLSELRERTRKYRQELLNMSSDINDQDSVMQVNIQIFPTALLPKKGEEEK